MSVTLTMGFQLLCRLCGAEIFVGNTRTFQEVGTGERTAYSRPGTNELAGVSEGPGDTFECALCHASKWVRERGQR